MVKSAKEKNTDDSPYSLGSTGIKSSRLREEQALVDGYNFKDFNFIKFVKERKCPNFAAIGAAKRRAGKSTFLKDICYQAHKEQLYSECYVFSLTAHLQRDLFDYVPKENIYYGMDEKKLKEIWNKQEIMIGKLEKQGIPKSEMPMILCIFDDIIGDANAVKYSEQLLNMAVAGRHLNLATIILTQHFHAIKNTCRDNVDWFFCFKTKKKDNRVNIIESYMDLPNSMGEMVLRKITADTENQYQCMVIDNMCIDDNPEEYIFKYTAKEKVPKFMIGSKTNNSNYVSAAYFDNYTSPVGRKFISDGNEKVILRNSR